MTAIQTHGHIKTASAIGVSSGLCAQAPFDSHWSEVSYYTEHGRPLRETLAALQGSAVLPTDVVAQNDKDRGQLT